MIFKKKAILLTASVCVPLGFAGCSGGGNGGGVSTPTASPSPTTTPTTEPTSAPNNGPNINVVAVTDDNRLISFNAQRPGNTTPLTVSGIPTGQKLVGLDYRFAPDTAGTPGLYGLTSLGAGRFQLVKFTLTASTATASNVGAPFTAPLDPNSIGFDFNPQVPSPTNPAVRVDRIRVVSGNRTNLRLNPNTGAVVDSDPTLSGTQLDGKLTFDADDIYQDNSPRVVAVAYTNNVASPSPSGTINYCLDISTNDLLTLGRADRDGAGPDVAVSPNTGRLFTLRNFGSRFGNRTSFDIGPGASNNFLFVTGRELATLNISNFSATSLGNVNTPDGIQLTGLAIVP
ncbi:DUF4394 domain-containing protein [bacterium]|nr:MAG: DUF4394 domain-containing protein [bacterium]